MTPEALAGLHAACFTTPRPWSAAEFSGLLADPQVFLIVETDGFLLGRAVMDEAEVLTLAVASVARRQGFGARLVAGFLAQAAARGAGRAFLEVAADNAAAIALYARLGFVQAGRRRRYFRTPAGDSVDALVLARPLAGAVPPGI
ncbi:GNAT family N-acetyltransferase [Paracoccaceae bacterium Fryx2]|nr:GNAT family N-acetyltransferase [Paracoccaceae bacterium Fryx2]